jgi:hypothetical protein
MAVIVVIAFEMSLFQEVWFIVLSPFVTMALLAINLGFVFLMLRPPALESRIVGMLLGSAVALFATAFGLSQKTVMILDHIQNGLVNRASALPDQQGLTFRFFRLVANYLVVSYFALLDLLGVALFWAGGLLESRWRSHRARAQASVPSMVPPLDERTASPL